MAIIDRTATVIVDDCTGDPVRGKVRLVYDTLEVVLVFPDDDGGSVDWTISRDVLARLAPGGGDCRCGVDGSWVVLHLTGVDSEADINILRGEVDAFLGRTARAVPYGTEVIDFDAELDQLLKDGAR